MANKEINKNTNNSDTKMVFSAERGNVAYAQAGDFLWIKVRLTGDLVTSKSGNNFLASGPVIANMGEEVGKAHAWLNLNLPKPSKKALVDEVAELRAKLAKLETNG